MSRTTRQWAALIAATGKEMIQLNKSKFRIVTNQYIYHLLKNMEKSTPVMECLKAGEVPKFTVCSKQFQTFMTLSVTLLYSQETCTRILHKSTCTSNLHVCRVFCTSFLHRIRRSSITCKKLACTWPKLRGLIGQLYNTVLVLTKSLLLFRGVCY